MRRNNKGNHHRGSFAACACLASVALLGGLGSTGSRAAAALAATAPTTAPADSELALRLSAALETAPASPSARAFQRGSWDVEIIGAHMAPCGRNRDHFNAGSVAVGYFLADGFSANLGLSGDSIDQPHNYALGAGVDLYARLFLLTLDRFSVYADAGIGAIFTDKAVPEFGTAVNFTPRGGLGVSFRVADNTYLVAGARYWHLSNADYHGHPRNPAFDSIEYYGGVMFTF